jgi:hypothetical protein
MARLNEDQWARIREEWECSPRKGVAWLTTAHGGPWDITEDPIRLKRDKEGWTKRRNHAELSRIARRAVAEMAVQDTASPGELPPEGPATPALETGNPAKLGSAGGIETGGPENPSSAAGPTPSSSAALPFGITSPPQSPALAAALEDPDVAHRARVLDGHRREWSAVRAACLRALRAVQPGMARGKDEPPLGEVLAVVRAVPRAIQIVQAGERHVFGLDADLVDFEKLSDAQLQAIAAGRSPR